MRRLGRGGMAEVFLARAMGPGGAEKLLCLKRILPAVALDPRTLESFAQEARLVLSLQHANVVPVFDFGREGQELFLAMEWIDGCDLATLVGAPLPPLVAAYVACEVAKALGYAHGRRDGEGRPDGLLHRDVTPRNILVSRLGEVRLTDFGIARALGAAGQPTGTPPYMSPEQARGESMDARSDLYSLGLVLAEMILGRRVRQDVAALSETRAALAAASNAADIPELAGVPPAIGAVVARLLAAEPAARFAAAFEAESALSSVLAEALLRGELPPAQQLSALVAAAAPVGTDRETPETPATLAGQTVVQGSAHPFAHERPFWVGVAMVLSLTVVGLVIAFFALRVGLERLSAADDVAAASPRSPPAAVPAPTLAAAPVPPAPGIPASPETSSAAGSLRPARLRVTAPGSWVAVYLDGRKLGDDAGAFEIPSGKHTLRVENPPLGFSRTETLTARPGELIERSYSPAAVR